MQSIDWIIIISYLSGLILLGWYLGRRQENLHDYFLGSRSLSWWAVGFSTMATQLGAISFISAPAFVGMRAGGGLKWLGYEFAVPLAMIILIWKVIPLFHKSGVISIYEYLEKRFDPGTRRFVSIIFLVSRALATGVTIYATAIVVSVILGISLYATIIIIGAVAIIYDYMGGIKAVVYSDVIQMIVIIAGIAICLIAGLNYLGGWEKVLHIMSADRFRAVNFGELGLGSGDDYGFLPLLIGGFFLYTSYYGFDQSQVQRELSAKSLLESRKSLLFNAVARYPVVLSYCILGLVIGAYAAVNPEFSSLIPRDNVDYMVPTFVVHYLPAGVSGFIIIAILAASMSSLDTALNSLSASTIEDILKPTVFKNAGDNQILRLSKITTLAWGLFCTGFAFLAGSISATVIESINMIGSIFYGPIAAVFFLGIFVRRSSSRHAVPAGLAGVAVNLLLAAGVVKISWLWWNVTGFSVSFLFGCIYSIVGKSIYIEKIRIEEKKPLAWILIYASLILYTILLVLISIDLKNIL